MKTLIIEDEKAALRNLKAVMQEVDTDFEIVGEVDSIFDGVEWFRTHPMPELVFMDIHLADGMNEKGVSIAVLTLDSDPVHQDTGKPTISTTLAIRLVLDRAASTEEAVTLLKSYDMFASSGRDYHFYITDANGDGRVIEYDCNSNTRELVDTKSEAITNFFILYKDKVAPNQRNGIYGHGRERYDAVLNVFETEKEHTNTTSCFAELDLRHDGSYRG